jgi:hypothetical protein
MADKQVYEARPLSIPDSMISMSPAMTAGPERFKQATDFKDKPN